MRKVAPFGGPFTITTDCLSFNGRHKVAAIKKARTWPASRALLVFSIILLAGVAFAGFSQAIDGTVTAVSTTGLTFTAADGTEKSAAIPPGTLVLERFDVPFADIREGDALSVLSHQANDGTLTARSINIFPVEQWELARKGQFHISTGDMVTIAVVTSFATKADGHSLALKYKDLTATVEVPKSAAIHRIVVVNISAMKAGMRILVMGGTNPDGSVRVGEVSFDAPWGSRPPDLDQIAKSGTATDVRSIEERVETGTATDVKRVMGFLTTSSDNGYTWLMLAALRNPNAEVVTLLVDGGIDVNAKTKSNRDTALTLAANFNQNSEVVSALLKAGADVNAKNNNGDTALILAAYANQNSEVVSALLKAGADINAKNNSGVTALMLAAFKNHNPEVVSMLLQAGADASVRFSNGATALDGARQNPAMQNTIAYRQLAAATPNQQSSSSQQSNSNQGSGTDLMGILNGLSSLAQALQQGSAEIANIRNRQTPRSTLKALAQNLNSLNGGTPAPGATNNNTSNSIQGQAGTHGGPYNGPGANTVHELLGLPSVKPYIRSWTPPAPQLPPANGQREALIAAAIEDAWGAEAEARAGRPKRAEQLAAVMHENLKNAYLLRSTTPLPIGGPGSTFTADPISDGDLKSLLDAY